MDRKKSVVVVTFVWRDLRSMEKMALNCGLVRLARHPFAIVHPKRYSIDALKQKYPQVIDMPMADEHFVSVDSYNEMMLTADFYRQFQQYDFMLIYQLDAFVFRDELDEWVARDYDYIGAPWLPSDSWWQRTVGEMVIRLRKILPSTHDYSKGRMRHAAKYFEVGNGGFSLRKVSTMLRVLTENRALIDSLPHGSGARQEDIVFSVILGKKCGLKKPDWHSAVQFAFCDNPNRCFRITKGRLPFGCHAWDTCHWENFWRGKLWFDEELHGNMMPR